MKETGKGERKKKALHAETSMEPKEGEKRDSVARRIPTEGGKGKRGLQFALGTRQGDEAKARKTGDVERIGEQGTTKVTSQSRRNTGWITGM